jgi:enamine deaminase RidA (YjgF/YER057c/UK114 family)
VVKLNTYVVNLQPEVRPILAEVRSNYFNAENPPAGTLVGVPALAREGLLIEMEVVAVAD